MLIYADSRMRIMGTTRTQQGEGYGNHRDTASRGLWEPQGHSRQRIMRTTGTQQAEGYGNHRDTAGRGL